MDKMDKMEMDTSFASSSTSASELNASADADNSVLSSSSSASETRTSPEIMSELEYKSESVSPSSSISEEARASASTSVSEMDALEYKSESESEPPSPITESESEEPRASGNTSLSSVSERSAGVDEDVSVSSESERSDNNVDAASSVSTASLDTFFDPEKNVATFFDIKSLEWENDGENVSSPEDGNIAKIELHSVRYDDIHCAVKSKTTNSWTDWQMLIDFIEKSKGKIGSADKKFVTLWADLNWTTKEVVVYFEMDKSFLESVDKLSPWFHVVGDIKCEYFGFDVDRYFDGEDEEDWRAFAYSESPILSYHGVLEPAEAGGELFREKKRSGGTAIARAIISHMNPTNAAVGDDDDDDYFEVEAEDDDEDDRLNGPNKDCRLKISWKMTIKWTDSANVKQAEGNILSKIFSCESSKDLTIVVGGGVEVKCHKLVFTAGSPVFAAIIEANLKESKTSRVELLEFSEVGFRLLLPYLYGMGLSMYELDCEVATELFQAAHKYNLLQLEEELEKWFLKRDFNWFNADAVLELYYFSKNLEQFKRLERHLEKTMKQMRAEIRECDRFKNELDQSQQKRLCDIILESQSSSSI